MTRPGTSAGLGHGDNTTSDLAKVTTAERFGEALSALRTQERLSIREVSKRSGIPSGTLGGYFTGRHLPQVTQREIFEDLLAALSVDEGDFDAWWDAVLRMRRMPGKRSSTVEVPYRGLDPYRVEDSGLFVGREDVVADLVGRVEELADAAPGSMSILWLIGPSGAGKSSLLQAGLAAALQERSVPVRTLVPSLEPLPDLPAVEDPGSSGGFSVLVVDQFEQLLVGEEDADRREAVLGSLLAWAGTPRAVLVLALRSDFYGQALSEAALAPHLPGNQVALPPLDRDALRRVVLEPAERAGWSIEPELVDLVMREIAPSGSSTDASLLPLLSHALMTTCERAAKSRMGVVDYLAAGGVHGALQRTAEEAYLALEEPHRDVARHLFLRLVLTGLDGKAIRRGIQLEDVDDDASAQRVIEEFVARRILVADQDELQIGHEVLLVAWERLEGWLAEDQAAQQVRRQIASAAAIWFEHDQDQRLLIRGPLLEHGRILDEEQRRGLTAAERTFLDRSLTEDARLQAVEERRRRRLTRLLACVAVLALIATTTSVYLWKTVGQVKEQRRAATTAKNEALSRQIALTAADVRETNPSLAAQLALAAYDVAHTVEARSAVLDVTADRLVTRFSTPEGAVHAEASPDGRIIATSSSDGVVRLWRPPAQGHVELIGQVDTHAAGGLFTGVFGADGKTFYAGGADGVISRIDVSDPAGPKVTSTVTGPGGAAIQQLAIGSDGSTLLAASSAPALLAWKVGDGTLTPIASTTAFDGGVQTVAQASTGLIATGSRDGRIRLWRLQHGQFTLVSTTVVGSETNVVNSLAISPDGTMLAAGARDKVVRVWKLHQGRMDLAVGDLHAGDSWINGVDFNADGTLVSAGASGGVVTVWSTKTWDKKFSATETANVTSAIFLPGRDGILTSAIDGIARLYPLATPRPPLVGDNIWSTTMTEDGRTLFLGIGTLDPTFRLVDVTNPRDAEMLPEVYAAPESAGTILVGDSSVSPDGRHLIGGTASGKLVAWTRDPSGKYVDPVVLPAADQYIDNTVFSPDSSYVGATGDDGQVAIYDTSGAGAPVLARTLSIEGGPAIGIGFSPDNSIVAVGGADTFVHLFRMSDGKETAVLKGSTNYVNAVTFNPAGTVLAATGSDRTVRLWHVKPDGTATAGPVLTGPRDTLFGVTWNKTGDLLGAASQDDTLWLWSDNGGEPKLYARLGALGANLTQLVFSPTSEVVFGAGTEGRSTSWSTRVGDAKKLICAASGTAITKDEWAQYVPGAPYRDPCG